MKTVLLFFFGLLSTSFSDAADLRSLTQLYRENFSSFYQPRFCGQNIHRLVSEASRRQMDLNGAVVVRLEAGGFWETRGFSVRGKVGEDEMLGYFHVFLLAEGQVFDFDFTAEPKILPLAEYLVEMYAPPSQQYRSKLRGEYRFLNDFPSWQVTLWNAGDYILGDFHARKLAQKKASQWVDAETLRQALEKKYRGILR